MNPPPKLGIFLGNQGDVNVGVNGSRGQTVVVESSADLIRWQALATNKLASDRWVYSGQPNSSTARYYRLSLR
jgi:hypothetical protein